MMNDSLYLHEQVMLLALKDKEGTVASGTMYNYALGGAILAELLLNSRVEIEEVKKKKFLRLVDSTPLGDPILDECLQRVFDAKRRGQLQTWVSRFASLKKLHHRVAGQLCRRGILRAKEDKILLIFNRNIYPEINPVPERQLIEQMREAIFSDTNTVEPKLAILISLANSASLLKVSFDKKKLKERKERIEQISTGDAAGAATTEAIRAMQAAMTAIMISTMVTTTMIHH